MKRVVLAVLASALAISVVAPVGLGAPATAVINVAFSSDYLSATITSTKGVSHYDVVLCDGTEYRAEIDGGKVESVGPLDAEIVSLSVKSATTKLTFLSGFSGECKKTPPDPDPEK